MPAREAGLSSGFHALTQRARLRRETAASAWDHLAAPAQFEGERTWPATPQELQQEPWQLFWLYARLPGLQC
ncbi:hypothetical protein [Thermogemmatispora sp.]|uniref:hypothetical protein n=1 Tax=Thermogemmatispora sp. TaxID=1968838 RepID=UPI0035E427BB